MRLENERPNFIVFVMDDQPQSVMGCMGNSIIRTPHMDQLAAEGTLFTNAFTTTAICSCSRASILTGQHMRRHGIRDFATPLSEAQWSETFPARLRDAGYRTGFIGKFAIGAPGSADPRLCLPADEFDSWYGFDQNISYRQVIDGRDHYLTTVMAERAVQFLQEARAAEPYCLIVAFKEPHGEHEFFDPDVPDPYEGVDIPPPPNLNLSSFEALPERIRRGLNSKSTRDWLDDPGKYRAIIGQIYRLISRADTAIGRIMQEVDKQGLAESTVVVHTSDHGAIWGAHGLRGKWLMYEDSIRVPFIVRDPRLPRTLRGHRSPEMALNIDLAPTILSMAGVSVPPAMQGMDLQPLMRDPSAQGRDDWYYEHVFSQFFSGLGIPQSEGVRTRQWKYMRLTEDSPPYEMLFDLTNDPNEEDDRARDRACGDQLDHLRRRCDEYRRALA